MSSAPANVLVVDDDPLGRAGFAALLRGAGLAVREAASGEEALRLAAELRPDLVLLDVVMPGLTGYEVCRRLKADPLTGSSLVLLVSGLGAHSEDRVFGLEGGADGYLAKPVEPAELLAQAHALLRARRAEEALARDALLLANVHDAIIVTDAAGAITYWNEGATRLLGWSAAEMLGRPGIERFPEHERAEAAETVRAIIAGTDRVGEWQESRKDGSRVWVEGRASRISDLTDRAVGVLELAHDVSQRKRAEAERESLIHQLQEALATVKTLRGLLPICAWCKKIRDDDGYWKSVETHLSQHLDVRFTHGICPACAANFTPGASSAQVSG
jgi:PAS domain S-box-containing protein